MTGYIKFDKEKLFETINKLSIERKDNQVITKFDGRIIKTATVSKIYEVFDIVFYLKDKIELISKNFDIKWSKLSIRGGKQSLILLSDHVEIAGSNYYKSFFIVNSTDKSRRLNLSLGLSRDMSKNYYIFPSAKNVSFNKRHIKGITKLAEDASKNISGETFDEQIASIKSLIGNKVKLSNIKSIIIDDITKKINHRKFDAFKNMLIYSVNDKLESTSSDMLKTLKTPSEKLLIDSSNDFFIDAYSAFQCYMEIFRKQDSHIIKTETEKIMNITQYMIREEKIKKLFA